MRALSDRTEVGNLSHSVGEILDLAQGIFRPRHTSEHHDQMGWIGHPWGAVALRLDGTLTQSTFPKKNHLEEKKPR